MASLSRMASFLVTLPLVMISLGFESIDRELIEAAETMGASPSRTFGTVILPMILPYMFAGYAFVFVISMNEFIISFFIGQFSLATLPVKIFSQLRSGYTPTIASVSVALHPARGDGVQPRRAVRRSPPASRSVDPQGALTPAQWCALSKHGVRPSRPVKACDRRMVQMPGEYCGHTHRDTDRKQGK